MARWRNYYRMPDRPIDQRRVSCPTCGKSATMDVGQSFSNHCCGDDGEGFVSKEEATHYAHSLYSFCEYLGAREGKPKEGWGL